ncbi:tryptophan synthase beta chain [Alkalihalobacillus xiaoxiensis]|uniref:Tryptophan synthase beta chain n=1 Tax=Shouchella xiaoxiensis TaxID=766895 RepID=A0ABS2SZF5_9BACI|nr:tryptophan synthase subunit beta [Shouchella xiaoxiensis]MBM7840165.1 tryptophan synthase beta chain [Shouchella xiaoxiensis]
MTILTMPDERGRFGEFGGQYVPETLMSAIEELEIGFNEAIVDTAFQSELAERLADFAGRETPLTFAENLSREIAGAQIYLKREDLVHTGAHKLNNALGQALLAKRMGKQKLVAETGAGQHGVATATVAAKFGMECLIYMGEEDMKRQQLNVLRMELLGATVIPAVTGSKTLKDATNEAIRHWVAHAEDTFYLIGSVVGPHPYPKIVRTFQRIIGDESRKQFINQTGKLPSSIVACVGGGSNAIGMFYPFLADVDVDLIGVEAAGLGVNTHQHAATITKGSKGIIHGSLTYLLQDEHGQITEPYSISAGLDYPGVGPEHAYLADQNRVEYKAITDLEALDALKKLAEQEGIICALESAHAVAEALKEAKKRSAEETVLICLSGRGDKDMHTLQQRLKEEGNHV